MRENIYKIIIEIMRGVEICYRSFVKKFLRKIGLLDK